MHKNVPLSAAKSWYWEDRKKTRIPECRTHRPKEIFEKAGFRIGLSLRRLTAIKAVLAQLGQGENQEKGIIILHASTISGDQNEVIRFLNSGAGCPADDVQHIETHCAHVFLFDDLALKIKRAVRYDYLDQSTMDLRHALLKCELILNKATAPMIYRDVVAVTQAMDGGLELNGAGPPVEWVLRMHRFSAKNEMTAVADSGRLTDDVAEALGSVVQLFHAGCPVRQDRGDKLLLDILDELERVLTPLAPAFGGKLVDDFLRRARRLWSSLIPVLQERSASGHVKRVHGDLHLRNLLLIEGKPVLFDALEFDERLATCDVLYDLAFLLMDLCHRGLRRQANVVTTVYLLGATGAEDQGLAAMPLFLSVRAAIRAMVLMQTDQVTGRAGTSTVEARQYLSQAIGYLATIGPVLVAVGGMSGTGKTVLARDLAPGFGLCPGAVHLRTDTERKQRTGRAGYAPAAREAVYDQMFARAANLLAAGRSVIVDATFLDEAMRRAAKALAIRSGAGFVGLWLTAPVSVLIDRVASRSGDASDADAAVVKSQLGLASGDFNEAGWKTIDASGTPQKTLAAAKEYSSGWLRVLPRPD